MALNFRFEMFNVFNHTNFLPSGVIGNANSNQFGQATTRLDQAVSVRSVRSSSSSSTCGVSNCRNQRSIGRGIEQSLPCSHLDYYIWIKFPFRLWAAQGREDRDQKSK